VGTRRHYHTIIRRSTPSPKRRRGCNSRRRPPDSVNALDRSRSLLDQLRLDGCGSRARRPSGADRGAVTNLATAASSPWPGHQRHRDEDAATPTTWWSAPAASPSRTVRQVGRLRVIIVAASRLGTPGATNMMSHRVVGRTLRIRARRSYKGLGLASAATSGVESAKGRRGTKARPALRQRPHATSPNTRQMSKGHSARHL